MDGMNMLTALDGPAGGFRGMPAGEWSSETGRRQRLTGICGPGGECRDLFGGPSLFPMMPASFAHYADLVPHLLNPSPLPVVLRKIHQLSLRIIIRAHAEHRGIA